MIGKIMSEAAHSIIGMFSAKPLGMDNNVLHSDFGSLLGSPEEQAQFGAGAEVINRLDDENSGIGDTNAVVAHWDANNVFPSTNRSFGGKIFNQELVSQTAGQDNPSVISDNSVLSDGKLSLTFNRDEMVKSNDRNSPGFTAFSADRETRSAAPAIASETLLPLANVALGKETQINMTATPVEQSAEVTVGKELRNQQAQKIEGVHPRSQTDENAFSTEVFPSSEKGLLKLQSQFGPMRNEISEQAGSTAKTKRSNELEGLDAQFGDQPNKPEPGKQAAALASFITKGAEHKDARSELGQLGLRSSSRDILPAAPASLNDSVPADSEFVEPAKLESLPANKSLEKLIEPQPITNSSAQLAVRETLQKPVTFDMSSPQVAERLASEISDLSVSGGPKKFELNPRNLGRMEITFTTRGGAEVIEIQTEHRAAKDMIVQHSQLLQDILKSQGRDDLTLRVDVKENMFASTRSDGGNLAQQDNRDAREQQARPTPRRPIASSFDSSAENDSASDNSRYA